jgi:hypothetical protein
MDTQGSIGEMYTPTPRNPIGSQHVRLCNRPAVLVRPLRLIALSFPQGKKIRSVSKTLNFFLLFKNYLSRKLRNFK